MCFRQKTIKPQQPQTKIKHKNSCQSQESNPDLSYPSQMRYLWTTETTEHID